MIRAFVATRGASRLLFAAILLFPLLAAQADPVVANVRASQRTDGSGLVDVYYNLSGGAGKMFANLYFSSDNGVNWNIVPASSLLSGDVGPNILNGTDRHIVWNVAVERPGIQWPQTKAKVSVAETGQTTSVLLPGEVPLEVVEIPAGSFTMGSPYDPDYLYESETPQHTVTIAQPFQIGKFEVTQAQWWAVLGSMPSHFTGPSLPVENVSWDDCQGFISKLNTMGKGSFRLPSEAEWEYACRAGSTTRWYYGQDPATLGDYAWYSNNQTYPVGQRLPNAFGLYDMSGNVWEWCQDWYHFTYEGAPGDGTAWILPTWSSRVLRGGAWNGYANYSRSAYRHTDVPSNGNPGYGMRVVRTP